MREKLRFKQISKIRLSEEGLTAKEVQPKTAKEESEFFIEIPIYDLLLESTPISLMIGALNTKIRKILPEQVKVPPSDLSLYKHVEVGGAESFSTNVSKVQATREVPASIDIHLLDYIDYNIKKELSSIINTQILSKVEKSTLESTSIMPSFDIRLESRLLSEHARRLNTEIIRNEIETNVESLHPIEGETTLPIFEKLIECDKRFPRSFSESLNSPFVLLIGEDQREWHIPIIYVLKELSCEITDRYPRITFREPEVSEEGIEERVDSLDPHSLDQFTFEYKIEFLDARRMRLAIDEFVRIVKGRLNSAFLQQFGVLVIAVKRKDLERAKKALKIEGIRVYTCKPSDEKYELFCSKILGVSSLGDFFSTLGIYEKCLEKTVKKFSIFVKRGLEATDKHQYPLKVATFVYLLNELRKRKKKLLKDFNDLCKFVKEVIDNEIKVESEVLREGKVVPDLIYSPKNGDEMYIEIETLIGTLEPLKKVDETVEKYKSIPEVKTIWIVVKPVSGLLHYEELKSRKRAYEVLYESKTVEFKVLTLLAAKDRFKWELVNLEDFVSGVGCVK